MKHAARPAPSTSADDTGPLSLEQLWRRESPKLIAVLTRMLGDVGAAEDLVADTFATALTRWREEPQPESPGAWLMTVAKRRALDHLKQRNLHQHKHTALQLELDTMTPPREPDERVIRDDLLRLIFIACHEVLSTDARVALTLRLLGGLTTAEIARAFLQPEPTVAARITRAKRTLADKAGPFQDPTPEAIAARLDSVLEVIYLVFNEGYSASSGDDWIRPGLIEDALRLGSTLCELLPREPSPLGLLALMELQASRSAARHAADGSIVLLDDQDRGRWDHAQIERGLLALRRAQVLGGARDFYVLQASIAACHARAMSPAATDWAHIAELYAVLAQVFPSPVIELNRAVAISRAEGPTVALPLVEALAAEPALERYPPRAVLRADLLAKLGRHAEAARELRFAVSLTLNERERHELTRRAEQLERPRAEPTGSETGS